MSLDSQEITKSINAELEKSLFGAAIVLIVMYGVLCFLHLYLLPGRAGVIMSFVAASSAVSIAAIAMRQKFQKSANIGQTDLGLIALVVLLNCVFHFYLESKSENTLNFGVLVVGSSFFFVSYRWHYTIVILSVLSWSVLVFANSLQSDLGQWSWFLFFSVVIGIAVHHQHRTSTYALARLMATHKRHAQELKELVSAPELTAANQEAMFSRIVQSVSKNLEVSSVGIWAHNDEKKRIQCVEFINHASALDLKGHIINESDGPRYFDALLSTRVIAADDVLADPRTNELSTYLKENSITSMLDAPIKVRGDIWGVICIEHRGPMRVWDANEQAFAASVADVASIAIQGTENAKLEKRSRQAEQLESLGILAGGVAHDFNNLLTVIIGQTEFVKRATQEPKTLKSSQAVLEASNRAKDLAQQMLAYSGRATFLGKHYSLPNMLEEFNSVWGRDLVSGAELVTVEAEQELIVNVDATQIRQVISNLLTNARDSGANKIQLRCGKVYGRDVSYNDFFIHSLERDAVYAWVEIEDDGVGMSESVKANIFDPFFTTRKEGTGLGLAAVLGILKAHRGSIEVESNEGEGSRFRLLLPLEVDAAAADTELPIEELSKLSVRRQKRVMLVEDEELIRELAESLLAQSFDDIVSFSGVAEALSSIQTMGSADLSAALIDLSLGDGNGLQVIEVLEQHFPALPIVLMSGFDAHDTLSKLPKTSNVEFLHKPFTQTDLLKALQNAQSKVSR